MVFLKKRAAWAIVTSLATVGGVLPATAFGSQEVTLTITHSGDPGAQPLAIRLKADSSVSKDASYDVDSLVKQNILFSSQYQEIAGCGGGTASTPPADEFHNGCELLDGESTFEASDGQADLAKLNSFVSGWKARLDGQAAFASSEVFSLVSDVATCAARSSQGSDGKITCVGSSAKPLAATLDGMLTADGSLPIEQVFPSGVAPDAAWDLLSSEVHSGMPSQLNFMQVATPAYGWDRENPDDMTSELKPGDGLGFGTPVLEELAISKIRCERTSGLLHIFDAAVSCVVTFKQLP